MTIDHQCYFFLPGLSERYRSGAVLVVQDIISLINQIPSCKAGIVTTHERHPDAVTFEDLYAEFRDKQEKLICVATWGPLIGEHAARILKYFPKARLVVYAQSYGWDIRIPSGVPIICTGRFVMALWSLASTEREFFYIPPPLHPCFAFRQAERDIDILVHTRKQNIYCLKTLLPALQKQNLNIEIIDDWIPRETMASLLNRTKIFLYLTELHPIPQHQGVRGEGFGMPALEAAACGAQVGSNLMGGVTDFLTPGENCIKLQTGSLETDVFIARNALKNFQVNEKNVTIIQEQYSAEYIRAKWAKFFSA